MNINKTKIIQSITASIIIIAILGGAAVFAATGQKTLTADFNDIKITIDGKLLTPKDANGQDVVPFTVDGTTYLPVRALAEAFGKDVRWDGETGTVVITTPDAAGAAPRREAKTDSTGSQVKLSEMEYFTQEPPKLNFVTGEAQANTADYLQDCMVIYEYAYSSNAYTRDYLINNEYKKISGTVFLGFNSRATKSKWNFQIWGDGKLIYTSKLITGGSMPEKFNVDISGVKVLKIGFVISAKEIESVYIGLSEVTLQKK